jgi:hypothetical protein
MIQPSVFIHDLFASASDDKEICGSLASSAEVFMANSPPRTVDLSAARDGDEQDNQNANDGTTAGHGDGEARFGGGAHGGTADVTQDQMATLAREAEQTPQTPVDTSTSEGIRLEAAHLATLVERVCSSRLERNLMALPQDVPRTSGPWRQIFPSANAGTFQILSLLVQNLVAATRIVDIITK